MTMNENCIISSSCCSSIVMLLMSVLAGHAYVTDLTVVEGEDVLNDFAVIRSVLNEGNVVEELIVEPKQTTFEEARKSCLELENGHLVVILDQAMQDKMEEAIVSSGTTEPSVWVGMKGVGDKASKKYDLQWLDGTVYEPGTSFNNFHSSDPNDDGEVCIFVATGKLKVKKGKWMDGGCQLKKPFICEHIVKSKNHYLAVKEGTSKTDAITDVVVIHGNKTNIQTPPGYELIKKDLYEESPEDHVYAAYTRDASKGDPIDQISVLTCHFNNEDCHCFDVNKQKIPVKLNNEPGGKFIFFCYKRANETVSE